MISIRRKIKKESFNIQNEAEEEEKRKKLCKIIKRQE